ncbi:tol-pal system YbgF family protein [Flavobacterium columnare]|uniref:Tetratricopeptide repeat protein n=1 Tax=Flavobacterium columnare TaxID=996 RepID=A0A437UEB5_9FLAO|nr:hypothetical protein [Flavobacterium columnare]RVU91951.1 hypothetical protein EH230_00155 [Flavobacterium columnare]
MSSNLPIIRQVNWLSLIPQALLMFSFLYIYEKIEISDPILYAILTYLVIAFVLRFGIAKNHRNGITFVKKKDFQKAIPEFKKNYDFFLKNKWLDDYRVLFLLSSSKISYREKTLCNIAFCYSQIQKGVESIEYYEKAIREFPKSELAKAGLNMLKSVNID